MLAGNMASGEVTGIRLTQDAMSQHIGSYGLHFVSVAITLFSFTSVVANFAYAQSNLRIFKADTKLGNVAFILVYLSMIFWGSGADLKLVWSAADMSLGLMTIVNITALILLTPTIVAVSNDYFSKRAAGKKIDFKKGDCTVQGTTEDGIWN